MSLKAWEDNPNWGNDYCMCFWTLFTYIILSSTCRNTMNSCGTKSNSDTVPTSMPPIVATASEREPLQPTPVENIIGSFDQDSYGYRPNRSAFDAIAKARERWFHRSMCLMARSQPSGTSSSVLLLRSNLLVSHIVWRVALWASDILLFSFLVYFIIDCFFDISAQVLLDDSPHRLLHLRTVTEETTTSTRLITTSND